MTLATTLIMSNNIDQHSTTIDVRAKKVFGKVENVFSSVRNSLEKVDCKIETTIPNWYIQNRLDTLGRAIEAQFAPLVKFNLWLDSNGQGEWYKKLAFFLAKLPPRAARNIITLLYKIVASALCFPVHPLRSLNNLAKLFVQLTFEMTKPQTWSKIGTGMIGAALGTAVIPGNPLSVLGIGIGGALLVSGLSLGTLKAVILAKKGFRLRAALHDCASQGKQLPESMLTGFCMGLMLGAIKRVIQKHHNKVSRAKKEHLQKSDGAISQAVADRAERFVRRHKFPYDYGIYDDFGYRWSPITLRWTSQGAFDAFREIYPDLFNPYNGLTPDFQFISVIISRSGNQLFALGSVTDEFGIVQGFSRSFAIPT